ncbi:hypothetical protein TorRG33x02_345520 [Trema orientale]|uniref:Uncharacterized protein n=1 Tax=Trema orientale TaxID=63057 RepID=A0A2P5ANX4_TREOI|nr:hypothetical protein TorRG33x02_345520 [Trema orientale]
MPNEDDNVSKAINSIIQKTSSLKCSDVLHTLKLYMATAESAYNLSVAFKILEEYIVSRRVIKDLIYNAWHLSYSWSVGSVGLYDQNIFHIHFDHEVDKKRVMDLRPWSINAAHIMVRDCLLEVPALQTDFSHSYFWIKALGLSPMFITEENEKIIGEKVGRFLEFQLKADGHLRWSRSFRIRVDVPLSKPHLASFYLDRDVNTKI